MAEALKEILFLRDMHRWALEEHSKHVADLNELMPGMEQHTNQFINAVQSTDADGHQTAMNIGSTIKT